MDSKWSFFIKAIFLFFGTYLFLYMLNNVFQIAEIFSPLWKIIIPPFAEFWGYEHPVNIQKPNADYMHNFFKICIYLAVSLLTTLIVLIIDFKRKNYSKQLQWLTVCIRYFICYQMLAFGLVKFFTYGQFLPLTEDKLTTMLGDMSASTLFFNFMSYSRPYAILAGILEVAGGLLLLNRRTVTLGALLLFGVMINVLMVNFCYNFIQKILSLHLLILLSYLVLLDVKGLYQFFILRKPALPNTKNFLFMPVNIRAKGFLKFTIIAVMFGYFAHTKYGWQLERSKEFSTHYLDDITQFFGVYQIENNQNNIDGYPLGSLPDSLNWKTFYQSVEDKVLIKTQNNKLINFAFEPDVGKQLFRIKYPQEDQFYELSYEQIDTSELRVNGNIAGNDVDFTMHQIKSLEHTRKQQNEYNLMRNKFEWIQDWGYVLSTDDISK